MGRKPRKAVRYRTISIPEDLMKKVERLVGSRGYRSKAEVVIHAIRRLLEGGG
jgi:Arc/MetJ-type ribon-helix-helix transcriptional regulator